MEKYAAVKEKLKKLSVERKGDNYDPFMPAQKISQNGQSKAPYNQTTHYQRSLQLTQDGELDGEWGASDCPQNSPYPTQEMTGSVAKAIGTLQSRSQQDGQTSAREDDLIAQEIYRLEMLALEINNRSQAQAEDILNLKRAAQQAAIAFGRQGIHDHPQLDVITRFFERYTTSHVPIVERDDCGHFTLSDYTINLRRAEEEALENAAILRGNRRTEALPPVPSTQPFVKPIAPKTTSQKEPATARQGQRRQKDRQTRSSRQLRHLISTLRKVLNMSLQALRASTTRLKIARNASLSGTSPSKTAGRSLPAVSSEQYIDSYSASQAFSFTDGAIWFSAAAIAGRITLKIVALFPLFQSVLWLVPLSLFCAAIYLLLIAKSSNNTLMYRLVLVALGLFLSSSL